MIIRAFVGSGGKTGTIFRQAAACRAKGLHVLVTTSTQMGAREETIIGDDPQPILDALARDGYAMAGQAANRAGKIAALSEATFAAVCRGADVVLVEADGSRQHPLKFPNDSEPVIPPGTNEIVVICGLSAIGKPAGAVCHRMERVKAALGIDENTIITPGHVARLVREAYLSPLASRYPDAAISLYPCQRDTLYLRAVAALLMQGMDPEMVKEEWFHPIAVFGNAPLVLEIVIGSENARRVGRISVRVPEREEPTRIERVGEDTLLSLPLEYWKVTKAANEENR